MSEHIKPGNVNKSSLPLAGILTLLGLLLLGFVTAAAVRHNPLYSDRDAYGISTYRLIETCKERLAHPDDLELNLQGQSVKLATLIAQSKQLRAGEQLSVQTAAAPAALVSGIQHPEAGKIGLLTPVIIGAAANGQQRALGQANMQCLYDRAKNDVDVLLSVGGAPQGQ